MSPTDKRREKNAPAADEPPWLVTPAKIRAMTRRLVDGFQPLRIILFGSQARRTARSHSDVDLMVVMPDGTDRRHAALQMSMALAGIHAPKDLIVTTPETIASRGRAPGDVHQPALSEGVVLYAADESEFPMNDVGPETEARRWLEYADVDLENSRVLLRESAFGARNACYLAQQAAEKALKALLVRRGVAFPFTHDLATLARLVPQGAIDVDVAALEELSGWGVQPRYPWNAPEPQPLDAQRAIAVAGEVIAITRSAVDT